MPTWEVRSSAALTSKEPWTSYMGEMGMLGFKAVLLGQSKPRGQLPARED